MRNFFGSAFLSVILSMMLAVATIGMGSMHGMVQAADPQMEAFIAAGGSPADICSDVDHGQKTAPIHCAFCLAAMSAAPHGVEQSFLIVPRVVAASFTAAAENATTRMVRDTSRSPRGPPVNV